MRVGDRVAFWVERDDADGRPVARLAGPARRMEFPAAGVQVVSDVMDLDPLPDLLKLRMPILLGMGEKDESVPVESAWFFEKKFKEVGKDNLAVRIYPGADHRLSGNGVSYRSEFFVELSRLVKATNQIASKRHISLQSGPRQLP